MLMLMSNHLLRVLILQLIQWLSLILGLLLLDLFGIAILLVLASVST